MYASDPSRTCRQASHRTGNARPEVDGRRSKMECRARLGRMSASDPKQTFLSWYGARQMNNFKLSASQILPIAQGHGGCIASDRITVDGAPVGYCYREVPVNKMDSGWR